MTDNKPAIFLSHSSDDRAIVEQVAEELRKMHLRPWLYEYDVKLGASIAQELNQALADADYFLLFWSEAARKSRWVQSEVDAAFFRRADAESVLVIPVLLDHTDLPPLLRPIAHINFQRGTSAAIEELREFFGREGFGPEQPPRLLRPGSACEDKLAAHRNMDLRLLLKARLSLNDAREMWIDVFDSTLENDLPGMPLGVVLGEMIIRADQRRLRRVLIRSICENRPDVANE